MLNYKNLSFEVLDNVIGTASTFTQTLKDAVNQKLQADGLKRVCQVLLGNLNFDEESDTVGASVIFLYSSEPTTGRAAMNVEIRPYIGIGNNEAAAEANLANADNASFQGNASILWFSRGRAISPNGSVLIVQFFGEAA